jgi:hypothetical protein
LLSIDIGGGQRDGIGTWYIETDDRVPGVRTCSVQIGDGGGDGLPFPACRAVFALICERDRLGCTGKTLAESKMGIGPQGVADMNQSGITMVSAPMPFWAMRVTVQLPGWLN